ncbi:probable G-protein coupled receptor 146 [Dasypus novemcinctus]|uniref:probable G-protein coupled receptor 146 n=1 Tax=Dasypus novemcinctus TaxID=9361 RepID=UPI00265FFE91|nr:probable G-protein coupled receptor 146 [Dasypus novemcinctus]XP_058141670.1 probable G-protein coupled receptor 146 [Dasypus novemcinctus]
MWGCDAVNSTGQGGERPVCQDAHLALSVLSLLYLLLGLPIGLGCNALLVLANLCAPGAMTMPDVYFVNMAVAGFVTSALAPAQLLGPAGWALWSPRSEVALALLTLSNVSSLVAMYCAALLSLDYYIARALPHTPAASVHNARHVCGFVWGGALLTSFSSLLLYICSRVSSGTECAELQSAQAADAIVVLIGYAVPTLAALYALVLILRLRRAATPLDRDVDRLDPSAHRLLAATVGAQFGLWAPHYLMLLGRALLAARGKPLDGRSLGALQLARGLSQLLAFSSGSVTPLLYHSLSTGFPGKVRGLRRRLWCARQRCPQDQGVVRQVAT